MSLQSVCIRNLRADVGVVGDAAVFGWLHAEFSLFTNSSSWHIVSSLLDPLLLLPLIFGLSLRFYDIERDLLNKEFVIIVRSTA